MTITNKTTHSKLIRAINSGEKDIIDSLIYKASTHDLRVFFRLAKIKLEKYYPRETYHMAQCKAMRCEHLDHLTYYRKLIVANRNLCIEIIHQFVKRGIDIVHLCDALDAIRNERTIN
jgi:hypothetical protein